MLDPASVDALVGMQCWIDVVLILFARPRCAVHTVFRLSAARFAVLVQKLHQFASRPYPSAETSPRPPFSEIAWKKVLSLLLLQILNSEYQCDEMLV